MSEPLPGRRRFFQELLARGTQAVADAGAQLAHVVPRRRRPPGAIEEMAFLARCTSCGDCVQACPQHAIFTFAEHVHPGAGTPVMVPDERACLLCDGWPCVAACETGALVEPSSASMVMGHVRISTDRCFVFRGPECGACVDLCPRDLRALTLVARRPTVDVDLCVGCGLCIAACPTMPAAIELIPLDEDHTRAPAPRPLHG